MSLVYDPRDAAVRADPFPLFRRLQDQDPVHWSAPLRAWIVTRYEDVRAVATNREMSPDRLAPFYRSMPDATQRTLGEVMRYLNLWMVFRDPPEHTRLRGLMAKAFTPRAVETLRPGVQALVDMLLDRVAARLDADGEVDWIAEVAGPLPALVIMDMLGVPRDAVGPMKEWSDEIALFLGSARSAPDKYERARHGAHEMAEYFRRVIAERRAAPRDDMISARIAARDSGQSLSEDELVASCMLLLFAGHETTTNLIGNAALLLALHRDQQDRLRREPGLIEPAIEEVLRFDGPSGGLARVVATGHEFQGKRLAEGDRVFAMLNAANRDPRAFARSDAFDVARMPNRHVTFGFGLHFCLGAPLSRIEGQVCLAETLRRFGDLRLARPPETLEWLDALIMRGVKSLPLVLERA
ncbi:MAG: cytochrome P450 [Rhodospirillales bacterium]